MPVSQNAYFVRREAQERRAAHAAADPTVRDIHLRLAAHYAIRALDVEPPPPDRPGPSPLAVADEQIPR